MLDRQIRLPCPQSQKAAVVPAAGIARIERESAIDQRYHRVDVLAKRGKRHSGVGQNAWGVLRQLHGPAAEVDAFLPGRIAIWGSVAGQLHTAERRKAESRPYCGSRAI